MDHASLQGNSEFNPPEELAEGCYNSVWTCVEKTGPMVISFATALYIRSDYQSMDEYCLLQVVKNFDVGLLISICVSAANPHCGHHLIAFCIPASSILAYPLSGGNGVFTFNFSHNLCSKGAMVAPCYDSEPGNCIWCNSAHDAFQYVTS